MATTAELVAAREQSLGIGKRSSPVVDKKVYTTVEETIVVTSEAQKKLDAKRSELLSKRAKVEDSLNKELTFRKQEEQNIRAGLSRIAQGLSTPQQEGYKNLSRMNKALNDSVKYAGYAKEAYGVDLRRIDAELKAVSKAEQQNISYENARREVLRKEYARDRSTLDILKEKASAGDLEAAKKVASKERFMRQADFYSRVIPKYTGETTGKKTGIYISPLTGKEVIVREGGANILPKVAQATYTEKRARDLYRSPTTVIARVSEETYNKTVNESATTPIDNKKYGGVISEDKGDFLKSAIITEGLDYQTKNNYFNKVYSSIFGTRKNIARLTTSADTSQEQAIIAVKGGFSVEGAKAQARAFKTGLITSTFNILSKPIDRAIFVGSIFLPEIKAFSITGKGKIAKSIFTGVGEVAEDAFIAGTSSYAIGTQKDSGTIGGTVGGAVPYVSPILLSTAVLTKSTGATATAKTKGQLLTKEVFADINKESRDLSIELAARPLINIKQRAVQSEIFGVKQTVGTQTPVLGETEYLTAKQLSEIPVSYIFDTRIKTFTATRPLSGSKQGISAPGEIIYSENVGRGRTTIQKVQEAINTPIKRYEVTSSDVNQNTVRQTLYESDVYFTEYDMPPTSELTTKNKPYTQQKTNNKKAEGIGKEGGSLPYEFKLDYFDEFTLENAGSSVTVRESPYTGMRDVKITPFIVEKITTKVNKKSFSKDVGISASTSIDVEIPQKDGTVKVQTVTLDFEPTVKQDTKQETVLETKKQKSKRTEQQFKELKQQSQQQKQEFKIYEQKVDTAQSTTVFKDAIVKFKDLTRVGNRRALLRSSLLNPKNALFIKQSQEQSIMPKQKQDVAQIQKTIQQPAQQVITIQTTTPAQDVAQVSEQISKTTNIFDGGNYYGSGGNAGITPPPVIPKIPTFNNKKTSVGLFPVFVRRRGVFTQVSSAPTYKEAVLKGASIVETTAAASFKVGNDNRVREGLGILGDRFRTSKVNNNIFVQKEKYRISSPGEVAEISRKGQLTSRKKKRLFEGKKWVF